MIATASIKNHFRQTASPMSDDHTWAQQRTYQAQAAPDHFVPSLAESQRFQPHRLNTQIPQAPVYSLDFLDLSAHTNASAQLSPAHAEQVRAYAESTGLGVTRPASWKSDSRARSTSESHYSMDDYDEDDEDDADMQQSTSRGSGRQSGMSEAALAKRKMKRFRLTHNQTRFLMNEFVKQPHPDAAHREYLSKEIPGLSPRQVQVWFQNRRAKLKRLSSDDRDRMLRSRTIPEELETGHKTQATASGSPALESLDGSSRSQSALSPGIGNSMRSSIGNTAFPPLERSISLPNPPRDETVERRQRRRIRIRRETTLLFGREVTIYVREDAGVDRDDIGSPDSYTASEDFDDVDSDDVHLSAMANDTHDPVIDRAISTDAAWPHHGAWPTRRPSIAMSTERRFSTQGVSQPPASSPMPQHRPAYMTRPSWPAYEASPIVEQQHDSPSLASAWYESQKTQVQGDRR